MYNPFPIKLPFTCFHIIIFCKRLVLASKPLPLFWPKSYQTFIFAQGICTRNGFWNQPPVLAKRVFTKKRKCKYRWKFGIYFVINGSHDFDNICVNNFSYGSFTVRKLLTYLKVVLRSWVLILMIQIHKKGFLRL